MVLVFKTSVESLAHVELVSTLLDSLVQPNGKWNFDLDDCDRIFRIEDGNVETHEVISHFRKMGYFCEELAD